MNGDCPEMNGDCPEMGAAFGFGFTILDVGLRDSHATLRLAIGQRWFGVWKATSLLQESFMHTPKAKYHVL
jgi:hypothetical protein